MKAALRLGAIVFVCVILTFASNTVAEAKYAALVINANTGEVLHSINADTRNYPASLTKMMTLYLVFDALKHHQISWNTRWKASARAVRQPPSRLGLRRGQTITVRQAVLAMITKSANDVAVLTAENMAGSERKFALKMTAMARKIGMSRTTFRNASGLPNRGHLSTARDMATLALSLLRDFPQYYKLFSTVRFEYKGRNYRNHNKLLTTYEGTDGIKTGYISAAGFNLVASVKRGDTRLIGVVFGGRTSKQRNRLMVKYLNKGFATLAAEQDAQAVADSGSDAASDRESDKEYAWGIQVGAFAERDDALGMANKAADLLPELIEAGGEVAVVPLVQKSGNQLYRARINGINRKQAYQACRALKRNKKQCMEFRVPTSLQVADAG